MLVIRTVCGNGIGSSLMAANNVKKICEELGKVRISRSFLPKLTR